MSRSVRRSNQWSISMVQWKTNAMLYFLLNDDIMFDAIMSFIDDERPDAARLAEFIEGLASDFWYQIAMVREALAEEDLDIIDWSFIRMEFEDIWLGDTNDE